MNCFTTLPHELLLLVLSYTSDEVDGNLLCVNHRFLTMLNVCLSCERLWELRYSNTFYNEKCCYTNVLPETSAYYGWCKLYRKVKDFNVNKEVTLGKHYVGPTGNIYFCWDKANNYCIKVQTCPVLELLLIEEISLTEYGTLLLVVYVSFDKSLRSFIMSNWKVDEEEFAWTITHCTFTEPCERYFIEDNMLIFLQQDGAVIFADNREHLNRMVYAISDKHPGFLYELRRIPPINCFTEINFRYSLRVDTFNVSYKGINRFTWPRTSPMYFECLRKEMERLSAK